MVLKPSSDAPTIAYKFFEILEEAGLPAGVVNFMTGSGAEVGDVVVDHPKTRFIAFTGSKEIGLRINERAAKVQDGQIWIKRVVAEMGGKDAIIVADDANLDEAATGVVQAAFGFQGQKCSACSRAIIDARVYDQMLEKIAERTEKIKLGDPNDVGNEHERRDQRESVQDDQRLHRKGQERRRPSFERAAAQTASRASSSNRPSSPM